MIAGNLVKGRPGFFSGGLYITSPDFSDTQRIFFPIACSAIEQYPSGGNYGNRQYLVGGHSAPIIITEEYKAFRQSIPAPTQPPNISAFAPGPFNDLCAIRYFDEVTSERSPLSDPTEIATNGGRTWSGLPTKVDSEEILLEGSATIAAGVVTGTATSNFDVLRPGDRIAIDGALTQWAKIRTIASATSMTIDDTTLAGVGVALIVRPVSRVSHIELWLSEDGSFYRFLKRVRLGTTSVVESIDILAAGEAETESFTAMPKGTVSCFYNKRQHVAGVEGRRDLLFSSALEFPERWEGLAFRTLNNEPIVGMLPYSDYVLVFTPVSTYVLTGFAANDYVFRQVSRMGSLGHACNTVTKTQALVVSKDGAQLWNGSYHSAIPTRYKEWLQKYRQHKTGFEMGISAVNEDDQTYQFYPYVQRYSQDGNTTLTIGNPVVWVGNYSDVGPADGGALIPPEWVDDTPETPRDSTQGETGPFGEVTYAKYIPASGEKRGVFYRGDTYGRIFEEGILGDENLPALHTNALIVTGHNYFGQFGGDRGKEGKKLVKAWWYVRSELSAWSAGIFTGDDYCWAQNPITDLDLWGGGHNVGANQWAASYDLGYVASLETDDTGTKISPITGNAVTVRFQPKTVHQMVGDRQPEGRGFTFQFEFENPLAARFIGFGLVVGPGTGDARPPVYAQDGE